MKEPNRLKDGTRVYWGELPARTRASKIFEYIGETFLTLGIILGLFVGYKAILQDNQVGQVQQVLAKEYEAKPSKFVALNEVDELADIFAQLYVPRFGENWTRLVAEGTRWHPVLNEIGVGHYRNTAMPDEVGNFAVAAHRGGFGGAFKEIHRLQEGDQVYLKTRDYWFTYKYLQTKIVEPTATGVLGPVPDGLDGAVQGGRYMTFTSCTPIFVNTERIIVWFELVSQSTIAPVELESGEGN